MPIPVTETHSAGQMTYSMLLIEDDLVFNQLVTDHLGKIGYRTTSVKSWTEARKHLNHAEPDLIIMDKKLPDADALDILQQLVPNYPVVILTAFGSVQSAVEAIKNGASEYLSKPINLDELELVIKRVLENARVLKDLKFNRDRIDRLGDQPMVGKGVELRKVHSYIDAVAREDMTVLVLGESGAGKELVARSIHRKSTRADRNFVTVDCCAFSEELFESELFGHEKGAFTSADRRKMGLIEGAQGGTLFLDEMGEIRPAIQAKLLHVLETGVYRRVGGTKDLHANVRFVVATNRDLGEMCESGKFRSDLFYRLNGFVITVPPLRERREDIPDLVRHFIRHHNFSCRITTEVGDEAMAALVEYDWPGNVRELKNVVERALILKSDAAVMTMEHLTFTSHRSPVRQPVDNLHAVQLEFEHEPSLESIENKYVNLILNRYQGRRNTTADILGISERTLYRILLRNKSV